MRSRCPTCDGPVDSSASNRHRPFCSARCQLLDLGHWLDEDYAIPGPPTDAGTPERPEPDEA